MLGTCTHVHTSWSMPPPVAQRVVDKWYDTHVPVLLYQCNQSGQSLRFEELITTHYKCMKRNNIEHIYRYIIMHNYTIDTTVYHKLCTYISVCHYVHVCT